MCKQQAGDYSTQNVDFRQEFLVLGSKLPNAATNDQDTRNKGVLMKFKMAMCKVGGDVFIQEVLNIAWEEMSMRSKLTEVKFNNPQPKITDFRTNMNFRSKMWT